MITRPPPIDFASSPVPEGARGELPRERVLRNTLASIASQAASDGSLVLAALIQMKALGQAQWGLFGFLLSTFEVLRVVTDAGLHVVGIRLLAVRTHPPLVVVRHVLLLKSVLALLGLVAAAGLSFGLSDLAPHRGLLLVLGAALFPFAYAAGLALRFQAEHRMERLIAPRAVAGGLYLAGVIVATWCRVGVASYVVIYAAYQLAMWMGTAIVSRRTWPADAEPRGAARPDWRFARTIARQASAVALLQLLVITYSRLGVFLLEGLGSLAAVGQYYTAVKFTEPLLTLAGAFSVSAFPVLTRLVEGGRVVEARQRFLGYSVRSAVFTSCVAAVATVCGKSALSWIGPEYAAASGALTALAWATAFMFQNQLSSSMIYAFGRFHYVTVICGVNLVVFLALSVLLVPRLGATGAGLSLLGTESANTVMQLATVFLLTGRGSGSRQTSEVSSGPGPRTRA